MTAQPLQTDAGVVPMPIHPLRLSHPAPFQLSSTLILSPASIPSPTAGRPCRRVTRVQLLMLVSIVLPLVLTWIPLHSPVPTTTSTNSWENACMKYSGEITARYEHCTIGGACCPIDEYMFGERSTRCTLSGQSCYEPVLGTWGLFGVALLVFIVWCFILSRGGACKKYMCDELYGREEEASVPAEGMADPRQYERLSELVELH